MVYIFSVFLAREYEEAVNILIEGLTNNMKKLLEANHFLFLLNRILTNKKFNYLRRCVSAHMELHLLRHPPQTVWQVFPKRTSGDPHQRPKAEAPDPWAVVDLMYMCRLLMASGFALHPQIPLLARRILDSPDRDRRSSPPLTRRPQNLPEAESDLQASHAPPPPHHNKRLTLEK